MTDVLKPEPARDPLVAALRGRLPDLVHSVLNTPTVVAEIQREVPVADQDRVRGELAAQALADSDEILRATNPKITALRLARDALTVLECPDAGPAEHRPSPRDRAGNAAFGFVLWLGMAYPILFWQLKQTPLSGFARFAAFAGTVLALLCSLAFAVKIARWAGRRFTGRGALDGAGWLIVTALVATYLVLLWRLWRSSVDAMGWLLSLLVWGVPALGVGFVVSVVLQVTATPLKDEQPGQRVPREVYLRGFAAAGVAGLLSWLLLAGIVRLPWPEWATWLTAHAVSLLVLLLAVPAALSPGLVPARLSQDPDRRGSAMWLRRVDQARDAVDSADKDWLTAATDTAISVVSRHLGEVVNPAFSTTLPRTDRAGLGLMRAGDRVFETAAFTRLRSLTDGISGGAIGIAGPRGCGKSTLLDAYRAGKFLGPGRQHIALLESVPVRYDAREFVLHLFSRCCSEVIRFCDERVTDKASRWPARLAWARAAVPPLLVVALWVLIGYLGSTAISGPKPDLATWLTTVWWPVVAVLGAASLLWLARRRGYPATAPPPLPTAPAPGDLRALRDFARQQLDGIEFQQKHTSGWSGKIGLGFGAEAGRTGSHELTRQPRSYPRIVHEFGEFLRAAIGCLSALPDIATPSVVIILDELDKILSPDEAQDFVNEVKVLFDLDVRGFLFVVSVSEDALASFERRGLPVRDAFDSAFDVIFRLGYLSLGDARSVLNSRVLGLPEPFVCLSHCLSGGLPRELIRVARQVTAEEGTLDEACHRLVADDLAGKVAGLRTVVARESQSDVAASELVRHVEAHAVADAAALLRAVANPPVPISTEPETVALQRTQLETLGYLYYLASMREVFSATFSEQDLARGRDGVGDCSFDTLASVRQLFAVNARLAWLTIGAFRAAWDLPVVAPPEQAAQNSKTWPESRAATQRLG
ncbi:MAG TPA: transcriptional regulator [Amycolatopsis sp.]|nr:transcriptional regulator [Amycolatopsis sp.]